MPEIHTVQTNHDRNGGEFLSLPLLYCHQRQAKPCITAVRGGDRSGHVHNTINKHKRDLTVNMPTLKHCIRLLLIANLSLELF